MIHSAADWESFYHSPDIISSQIACSLRESIVGSKKASIRDASLRRTTDANHVLCMIRREPGKFPPPRKELKKATMPLVEWQIFCDWLRCFRNGCSGAFPYQETLSLIGCRRLEDDKSKPRRSDGVTLFCTSLTRSVKRQRTITFRPDNHRHRKATRTHWGGGGERRRRVEASIEHGSDRHFGLGSHRSTYDMSYVLVHINSPHHKNILLQLQNSYW